VTSRSARRDDLDAVARIYNEGIEGHVTFETEPRSAPDIESWLQLPLVVVEDGGAVVAWARVSAYRAERPAYNGVGEFGVYVAASHRGRGAGKLAMEGLIADCEARGYWKLLSRIFPENRASLALCGALGFREVGVYRRHARLHGEWRDCVIVEKLIGEAQSPPVVHAGGS
jgi:L-amino acid N-acyltransferase YncA